ncbi:Plasmodium variant antigen protein Cir/Yir/Bir, putative, partial [Plasmodium chabaudi adami]
CQRFNNVWNDFPESVGEDENSQLKINDYWDTLFKNKSCDNDIDKVNAVSFWLFVQNFGNGCSFTKNVDSNTNIFHYIMIWLIYTLKLKNDGQTNNVMEFYNTCINHTSEYINYIKDTNAYNTYKNLIDNKLYFKNTGIKDISIFYDALNILYYLYHEISDKHSDCTKNLDYAKKFAEKYEVLLNNNDTGIDDSLYSQILSILSTDYDNFVKKCYETKEGCGNFPSLPVYPRSFSIKVTLIPITFIFVAIPIFLEFAYKYSLFGFGKRSQKQYLREK